MSLYSQSEGVACLNEQLYGEVHYACAVTPVCNSLLLVMLSLHATLRYTRLLQNIQDADQDQ
jgi:hypothetical protein